MIHENYLANFKVLLDNKIPDNVEMIADDR